MTAVIKVINFIKANSKTERRFKAFCNEADEQYIRLLLHAQVQWLSKGMCLLDLSNFTTAFRSSAVKYLIRCGVMMQRPWSTTLLIFLASWMCWTVSCRTPRRCSLIPKPRYRQLMRRDFMSFSRLLVQEHIPAVSWKSLEIISFHWSPTSETDSKIYKRWNYKTG